MKIKLIAASLFSIASVISIHTFAETTTKEPKYGLIEKYGRENVDEFMGYINASALGQRYINLVALEYMPAFERNKKKKQRILNSDLDYATKNRMLKQASQEYLQILDQASEKYKKITESYFLDTMQRLENKEVIERYRADVSNIDDLHKGLVIYTCSGIIEPLMTNSHLLTYEMSAGKYDAVGYKVFSKSLKDSSNEDRSYAYTSYIVQGDLIPTMPIYKFNETIFEHKNFIRHYGDYKSDPKVRETMTKYRDKICQPYADFVENQR